MSLPPSIDDIKEEFSYYMINISDNRALDKLTQLAITHNITAQLLAAEWMAYSCSNGIDNNNIDARNLIFFQSFLAKNIFEKKNAETPHQTVEKRLSTQSNFIDKSFLSDYGDLNISFTDSKSINEDPPNMAGESKIIYSYSGTSSLSNGNAKWPISMNPEYSIKPKKIMFEKATDVAQAINARIHFFDKLFSDHYKIEHLAHVGLPSQDDVFVVGMIICESTKTHIHSLMLQGSLETSCGSRILLEFSNFSNSYTLFPGQIVMFSGSNKDGNAFHVAEIFLPPLPRFLGTQRPLGGDSDPRELKIACGCGPYTNDDDFKTLSMLLWRVSELEFAVDVLFLMGPFVDVKQKSLNFSHEEQFERIILLLNDFLETHKRLQIVLVPSERDAFHVPLFPQPPFDHPGHPRLCVSSNPTMLRFGGDFLVSSCSHDSLFSLSAVEISNFSSGDRISRLLSHVLCQRSFQPVYPPPISGTNMYYCERVPPPVFFHRPHVMFVASDLRYFIKSVESCLFVNPGRVVKGERNGTFAYVCLQEDDDSESGITVKSGEILSIS